MKKIFALILAMVLCIGLLAACGSNGEIGRASCRERV